MTSHKSTPIQLPLAIEDATVEIPLTKGYVAIVDAIDADLLQYKWHAHKRSPTTFSAGRNITIGFKKQTIVLMHLLILERVLGRPLGEGEECDHWDTDPLNNRRSNLRLATRSQNMQNRPHWGSASGFKGVSANYGKWEAGIQANGKKVYLGLFDTPEAAYEAYCTAAKELHGEFARLE